MDGSGNQPTGPDRSNRDMSDQPTEGAEYEHDDGTVEVVFAVAEGRVLTVREYPSESTFEAAVAAAAERGVNDDVAELSVDEFRPEE